MYISAYTLIYKDKSFTMKIFDRNKDKKFHLAIKYN